MKSSPQTLASIALALAAITATAQTYPNPDLQHQPTLYVAPYAHLDTQWIWPMKQSIAEDLLKTMRLNFYYMDKYPHYVFNWTGSNRYRLMREYFPADYARLKQYVAKGQWYPSGSSVEEPDMNLLSAESLVRQVLYGNEYFRKDFNKTSEDFFLPDCFGIPYDAPEILAHAGVKGFSTGKLDPHWSPSTGAGGPNSIEKTPIGIPYNVGLWIGPDGSSIVAALHPGGYTSGVHSDLTKPVNHDLEYKGEPGSKEQDWVDRVNLDGKVSGVYADIRYVGTGDTGGATDEETVRLLEAIESHGMAVPPGPNTPRSKDKPFEAEPTGTPIRFGDGPLNVIVGGSDLIFKAITPNLQTHLPRYTGDLELTNHSAGDLTSQAYHKRWNRENEILANAAEQTSVAAAWLGGRTYPQQRLTDAWYLVLSGQFHDVGSGTGSPQVYQDVQNDDVIALNQFATVFTSATQSIASALDTSGPGVPIVVYNGLNIPREDIVEANIPFATMPANVRVTGPGGSPVPAQISGNKVLFLAKTPSLGFAVFHVEPTSAPAPSTGLKVTPNTLENTRYLVKIDTHGDVASIFDKSLNKELLSAPIRLAISNDTPKKYPAWNMEFDQEQADPRTIVDNPISTRIVENGPARIAIEVTRKAEDSTFTQTVRLSAGTTGDRVEIADDVDWRARAANLKAVFPLTATNKLATYTMDVGAIQRPTAYDKSFEVGTHHWIDLTDTSGNFGATLLTDTKSGSDKRTDNTLRITLIRTPGISPDEQGHPYSHQANMDWGLHHILYGLTGHADSWQQSGSEWQAYRLSTPIESFTTTPHPGKLGTTFSILSISDPHIRLLGMKKAEDSDDIIVRMVELTGKPAANVHLTFPAAITAAVAVNGQEQPLSPSKTTIHNGVLETSFTPFQMQSFAIKLGAAPVHLGQPTSTPIKLPYDLAASSNDDTISVGGFDAQGNALPAEMLPATIDFNSIPFNLAPSGTAKPDALIAKGQKLDLPTGDYNTLYILAASSDGDQTADFTLGATPIQLPIEAWNGYIGQWDTRQWKPETPGGNRRIDWAVSANHATWDLKSKGSSTWIVKYPEDYLGLKPGYIKRADIAWYADHHHTHEGLNQPYQYSYLFAYTLKIPTGATTLTLPKSDKIRILAISAAKQDPGLTPSNPLYDTLPPSTH